MDLLTARNNAPQRFPARIGQDASCHKVWNNGEENWYMEQTNAFGRSEHAGTPMSVGNTGMLRSHG